MNIPRKIRDAIANEIRKESDRYKRELAFLPVAQAFKNLDDGQGNVPLWSFAEACGFTPGEAVAIVDCLK